MAAIGHGTMEKFSAAESIALCARSTPTMAEKEPFMDEHGLALGTPVSITSESFGPEPTEGELIAATRMHYTLRRTDERAGTVHVHFPPRGLHPQESKSMISDFKGKTAVLTGAGSGFGLECARIGARLGMNLVLVDVQQDALDAAAAEMRAAGAQVLARKVDVSSAEQMEALAVATRSQFGAPHFVFNNAGVGAGGLVWENSIRDWEWVLGVNLWGVIHGVRLFTPMMLEAAGADPNYEGHIVNTASMAGLLTPPNMGIYNVSKHAVVSLTETLYQDLKLVSDQVSASVLCPYFVPTGISQSHRNRPADLAEQKPTQSQLIGQAMSDKAVGSGKVTAAQVAQKVFDAITADQFYIFSHPKALGNVSDRMNAIVEHRNPPDPFAERPEIGIGLRAALRAGAA
jgi:NAD(P)-dependent dehydrogenase (short-subunit alcohol dehydrogenase family)